MKKVKKLMAVTGCKYTYKKLLRILPALHATFVQAHIGKQPYSDN